MADDVTPQEKAIEEAGIYLSPEAIVMFPLAILLDLIGIILVIFSLDDFFITDIIGFAFIGSWGYFRSQIREKETTIQTAPAEERRELSKKIKEVRKPQKEVKVAKKGAKVAKWGRRLKWLELIPYLGWLPFWTVSVYFELKS
jgi:hypothetical protein